MPAKKQKTLALALTLILITQAGCVAISPATDSFCTIYEPVHMSRKDTEPTKKQIDRNNAAWMEICNGSVAR